MARNIQLPLIQDNPGEIIYLTLHDITPADVLDCQEPDNELIQSIAQYWVPPILVCPENRMQGDDHRSLYYPIDGKRRVKAVAYLSSIGYKFQGIPAENVQIQAVLRKDLLPEDEASYRIAFQANNLRSANPLTDVNAVKSTAQSLGVDVFTKEGRSAVAKELRTSPQVVSRLAKGLLVDQAVFTAYQAGQIADDTLKAILDMRDLQAKDVVIQKLIAGEKLSKKDIQAYNKQSKQLELVQANKNKPVIDTQMSETNPLLKAIEMIEIELNAQTLDENAIQAAVDLLKTLL
jgi:ParB-like chromosome segregation protein Spo0J